MAASLKDKRTPITTPPHQVPSVDVTLDPPTFSLDTTFNSQARRSNHSARSHPLRLDLIHTRLDIIHNRLDLIQNYPKVKLLYWVPGTVRYNNRRELRVATWTKLQKPSHQAINMNSFAIISVTKLLLGCRTLPCKFLAQHAFLVQIGKACRTRPLWTYVLSETSWCFYQQVFAEMAKFS